MKKTNSSNGKSQEYVNILGVDVNSTPKDELLKQIQTKLSKKIHFYIVTPNPEIILEASSNLELKNSLNNADYSIPDGVGLRMKVIKGREFMLDLFAIANRMKLKVYLLGSRKEVIEKCLEKIKKDYPNLEVEGDSGPQLDKKGKPISQSNLNIQSDTIKKINTFKPDLLFVAFGAPKQEIWLSNNLEKLNVTGAMVVGGSLDYYGGFVKPVPQFLNGNEWLWRLIQEPTRFKRIFNAVIVFPLKVALSGL